MLMLHSMWLLLAFLVALFPYLVTPLSMGCCLLFITLILACTLSSIFAHLWLSYTLVLILLGGLLVIFIYVALVASNELFSMSKKSYFLCFIMTPLLMMHDFNFDLSEKESQTYFYTQSLNWLSELYSKELHLITLFLIVYLFLTLIVVVTNTKNNKMTLRSL